MSDLHDPRSHSGRDVLDRIAVEVQRCEVILRSIETGVATMIAASGVQGTSHALQDIDLLGQSLADLATCLSGLAVQVGDSVSVDTHRLLAPLRLDDLHRRIGGRQAMELSPEERVALF